MSNAELAQTEFQKAKDFMRMAHDATEKGLQLLGQGGRKVKKPAYDFTEDIMKSRKRRGII